MDTAFVKDKPLAGAQRLAGRELQAAPGPGHSSRGWPGPVGYGGSHVYRSSRSAFPGAIPSLQ